MEYLMTYGWAILVIVIVLAALLYLGVFNLGSRVPDQCNFKVGLLCTSAKVSVNDGMTLKLQNTLGSTIYVCDVACSNAQDDTGLLVSDGLPACDSTSAIATIASGQAGSINQTAATGCYASGDGTGALIGAAGDRVRGKVYLWYVEQGDAGTNARIAVGDLQTTIQP